jgi:DNA-binding NtrC family response regulator
VHEQGPGRPGAGGQLHEDLLARFGEFQVRLLPLRERRDVILPLTERFMREAAANLKSAPVTSAHR